MIFNPAVRKSAAMNENGKSFILSLGTSNLFLLLAFNLIQTFEKGVFHALEKKYLERLLLNVHSDDPIKATIFMISSELSLILL